MLSTTLNKKVALGYFKGNALFKITITLCGINPYETKF